MHEDGRTYHLYSKLCPGQTDATLYEIPEVTAKDLMPQLLRDLQTAKLPVPDLQFLELDPETGWAYANVPVDFRIANARPVSVTASLPAPFNVWLTVTATPTTVRFDPGEPDGHGVTCSGAGAVAPFDVDVPGECSYAFVNSSSIAPSQVFTATATVEWAVSFRGSSGSGSQPTLTTTGTKDITVGEIQAVITDN